MTLSKKIRDNIPTRLFLNEKFERIRRFERRL